LREQLSPHRSLQEARILPVDIQGAEPFKGGYKIVADEKGLRLKDFWHSEIKVLKGFELSQFASWLYLTDKWFVPGDFSIRFDRKKYKEYERLYKKNLVKLERLKGRFSDKELKTLRQILLHNPEHKF